METQGLSKAERKRLKKERKRQEKQRRERIQRLKNVSIKIFSASLIGGLLFLVYFYFSTQKIYPSTTAQGHIEKNPPSHIMDKPMRVEIQKHMLEHSDGVGRPGVIINYNCDKFSCEQSLVDKLKAIVQDYPEHVYLAPFPAMNAKIALSRLGKLEILDSLDEQKIRDFIE